MDHEQSFSAERHFAAIEPHVPRCATVRPPAPDPIGLNVFYRDHAVPLGKCPHSGAERFARGQRYILEEFRLFADRHGDRMGLDVGKTIVQKERVHDAEKRAARPAGIVWKEEDLPLINGMWRLDSHKRDSAGTLFVYATCTGSYCHASVARARTRTFHAREWMTARHTSCVGCATARRRQEFGNKRPKDAEYSRKKRATLAANRRCAVCAQPLQEGEKRLCAKDKVRAAASAAKKAEEWKGVGTLLRIGKWVTK